MGYIISNWGNRARDTPGAMQQAATNDFPAAEASAHRSGIEPIDKRIRAEE